MMTSWGVLLPTGVIIARLAKHKKPDGIWFKIHRALQVSGLVLALAGWVVALVQFDVFGAGIKDNISYVHGLLGSMVMALGLLQPLNAFIRPHAPAPGDSAPKTVTRVVWEYVHKGSGYTAVVLSVITIAIGISRPARREVQMAFQIVYVLVLVCLLSLIGLLWLDRRKSVNADDGEEVRKDRDAPL
jgi:protein-S-isoprenylcysteine O-methyltransferase Ste14